MNVGLGLDVRINRLFGKFRVFGFNIRFRLWVGKV